MAVSFAKHGVPDCLVGGDPTSDVRSSSEVRDDSAASVVSSNDFPAIRIVTQESCRF